MDRTARERVERYRRGQRDQVRRELLELGWLQPWSTWDRALERLGLAALIQLRDAIRAEITASEREGVGEG